MYMYIYTYIYIYVYVYHNACVYIDMCTSIWATMRWIVASSNGGFASKLPPAGRKWKNEPIDPNEASVLICAEQKCSYLARKRKKRVGDNWTDVKGSRCHVCDICVCICMFIRVQKSSCLAPKRTKQSEQS